MTATAAARRAPRTVTLSAPTDFAGWRDAARSLAVERIDPADVIWRVADDGPEDLFAMPLQPEAASRGSSQEGNCACGVPAAAQPPRLNVPRIFVERAETVACHLDPARFGLLYRMLFRLVGEPDLLNIATDPDVRRLEEMEKAVRRDIHKMRAFVRFRRIEEGEGERYVAWFEPTHHIVERNAPFFVRRFTGMRWTILTPRATADWDGARLAIGPGAAKADAPSKDAAEDLWRTYFRSIFNPARMKVKAMAAEMPKKYWRNLPEASLIPELIAGAERSAREMIERMPTVPAPHHDTVRRKHWPEPVQDAPRDGSEAETLEALGEAAAGCRRCPLWRDATQTVSGEGPQTARVMFVGEQPGDQEDIAGKPFVGPAGRLFDAVIAEAGIDRRVTYVTNAVKHFKFEPRGKRRIHQKPNAGEVQACRWWLDKELALTKPQLVVALGATAAQSLLGRTVAITSMRGQTLEREDGLKVFLTVHPSYLLRIPDEAARAAERKRFLQDMQAVAGFLRRA